MNYDCEQLVQAATGLSVDEIAAEIEASGAAVENPLEVAAFLARCAEDPSYMPPETAASEEAPLA